LREAAGVSEISSSTLLILLGSLVGLLTLILFVLFGVSRCLGRIERRLAESASRQEGHERVPGPAETAAGGAFETFLKEDPARRKLPKGEQFAAYRRWRQENGMNWSNS
jgi:hypothetical protein